MRLTTCHVFRSGHKYTVYLGMYTLDLFTVSTLVHEYNTYLSPE